MRGGPADTLPIDWRDALPIDALPIDALWAGRIGRLYLRDALPIPCGPAYIPSHIPSLSCIHGRCHSFSSSRMGASSTLHVHLRACVHVCACVCRWSIR
jgi:hypothetical protein